MTEQHDLLKRLLDRAAIADARRAGSEHNGMSIMAQEEAQTAADLRAAASRIEALESRQRVLREALDEVARPMFYMRKRAEANGQRLGDMAYVIANSLNHVQEVARAALNDKGDA